MQKYAAEIVWHFVRDVIKGFESKYREDIETAFRVAFARVLDDVDDCTAEFLVSVETFRRRMQKYRMFHNLHQFSSGRATGRYLRRVPFSLVPENCSQIGRDRRHVGRQLRHRDAQPRKDVILLQHLCERCA
jgi:hypothetical protein